ncbi:MAG TPA: DUF1269 domain-containing protein [Armatimonadota bacterium]|jgi:hypothetical protein
MLKTMIGMFLDSADARRAVYALEEAKFPAEDISVAMRERYDSGFGGGSLLTGAVGNQASTTPMDNGRAKLPGLTPATDFQAPGYGPIVAAGPLAQALGGAALGVAAGGLTGALGDIGIPNDTARELIGRVRDGKETLVCIAVPRSDSDRVERLFVENRANEVYRGTSHTSDYAIGMAASHAAEQGF